MEYSLLTIVDDKDLAIRISDYLKLNNVDSYAAQSNKSDSGQWGVYIDGHNAEIAQDLLDSYTDTNNADSHSHAIYPSRRYSLGGSSHSWGYYLLLFLVVGCVRFHFKHKDGAVSFHRAQYKPTVTVPRYSPADIDDAVNRMKKDKDSISENAVVDDHPKITIKDIKKIVERSNQQFANHTDESIKNQSISMKGSKIYFDTTLKNGYVITEEVDDIKKEIEARHLLETINSYKSQYGDDILDQFAKLGVTFNFRLYYEGEKTPVRTIMIPISYIKKIDKT